MTQDIPDYLECQVRHAGAVNAYNAARAKVEAFNAGKGGDR
jgi:hypothetical protein